MADEIMEESENSIKQSQCSPDSRKRPLDGDGENGVAKKSHYIPDLPGDGKFNLKILIPSIAAGAIIGKGGETIAQLQKDANARVKMSKSNDYYPGTNERVCLITGNVEAILEVLCFIIEKIKDKPEHNSKNSGGDYEKNGERDKQIKILVPNSTAGMIIGKGGSYIKQIKEESGAYVQISQKAKDQSLAERCITVVSSDMENCQSACMMIIAKIVEDPQSGTCQNVSYSDMNGPVANPNPTGSPFANNQIHMNQMSNYGGGGGGMNNPLSAVGGLGNLLGGGVNLTLNLSSAYPGGGAGNPMVTGQLLDHVRGQLRGCGFTDQCNAEVCQAISTLINYGIIGLGLGLSNMQGGHSMGGGPPPLLGNSPGGDGGYHGPGSGGMNNGTSGPFGPIGTTVSSGLNLGQGLSGGHGGSHRHDRFGSDGSFDPFRRQGNDMPQNGGGGGGGGGGMPLNSNSFGLGTPLKSPSPGDGPDSKKVEMEVGEHIVGAIIGPGGKNLVEIQHVSGTSIQISKKGNYAPGTHNRVVTITGGAAGIQSAKYLIDQRINEEESKRARQTNAMAS